MITLYGIPNCDSVKKGRTWLDQQGLAYHFHDFRKDGLAPALLAEWLGLCDWQALLNTRGTTWRNLPEAERQATDASGASTLMLTCPTLIKRPVVRHARGLLVGFDAARWQAELSA